MSRLRWTLVLLTQLSLLVAVSVALAAPAEATVTGNLRLQGRSHFGGVAILYDGAPVASTNPDGDFAFIAPTSGPHIVIAHATGYLTRQFFLDDPSGFINLPPTSLRLGDADNDQDIDIVDLLIITSHYGQSPPADPRADLDGDGTVGVLDLLAVSSNFGQRGPLPWTDERSLLWTSRPNLGVPRNHLGVVTAGNLVYAIGGCCEFGILDGQNVYNLVEAFDPNTNIWSTRAPMPTARASLGVATVNGKIYALGGQGRDGRAVATVEEYDPGNNTWSTRAPLPTARSGLAVAVANGKLYAIGGQADTVLATVEEYDPLTDTWTTRASLPTARVNLGAAARGNRVYAIGGWGGQGHLGTVEMYTPATDTWTPRPAMSTPRSALAVVEANGRLVALGGLNDNQSFNPLAVVEEYDPADNIWRTETSMGVARLGLGATTLNGHIYAIGGYRLGYLGAVEEGLPTLQQFNIPKRLQRLPDGFPLHILPDAARRELLK